VKSDLKLQIGISSCLLGEAVRYDGQSKLNHTIKNIFQNDVDFNLLCPEVGAGLGVPRPAIELHESDEKIRALGTDDISLDVTDKLIQYAEDCLAKIATFDAYIFKARSPSCGIIDTPIIREKSVEYGAGLFTSLVSNAYPYMPMIDEGQLEDFAPIVKFIEHMAIYHDWKKTDNSNIRQFHETYQPKLKVYSATKFAALHEIFNEVNNINFNAYAQQLFEIIRLDTDTELRFKYLTANAKKIATRAKELCTSEYF